MKTAVVILNYNGRELLRQFLPSVIRFSPSAEIIVADNNSTDGSIEWVHDEHPTVRIIRIPENLGFCGGYNFSLRSVDAEYFVLLNSDVEVTEGWLDPIIDQMNANRRIAAAQPKILSYHHKTQFEYAGAAGGFIDKLGYPFCRGRIFRTLEEDHGQYDDTLPVFWATGACLVVRSSAFREMGGLDEDFFAHMEEIDLCWKLHRFGYQVYCVGSCRVYHVGGGTLSKSNPNKTYLNFRNGLSLIFKHLPARELWWKLPLRIGLDWCAAVELLLTGAFLDSAAIAKAHLHFFVGLRREVGKRNALNQLIRSETTVPVYPRTIVLEYYLFQRKTFKDLRF